MRRNKWSRKEMGGFYVGQKVRLSVEGKSAFPYSKAAHDAIGTVETIEDLSCAIKSDDPHGKRNFALRVQFPGYRKASLIQGNGAYFRPA